MNRNHYYGIAIIAIAFGFASTGSAACTNASLKGAYAVQITGTRPAPSVLAGLQATPGTTEQVAGMVVQNFDGAGAFTQIDNVKGSLSGITPDRAGAGTYNMNADCSGTYTLINVGGPPLENRFVLSDNGQVISTVVVSPQPVMVTSSGRKINSLPTCPSTIPPALATVTAADYSTVINNDKTIIVWGQGFTQTGGNTLSFRRTDGVEVVLTETSGTYFWNYSGTQINVTLKGLSAGTWTLSAQNGCSTSPSNSLTLAIR